MASGVGRRAGHGRPNCLQVWVRSRRSRAGQPQALGTTLEAQRVRMHRTAAAAWMAGWNQLAALGIPPGVVTKGACCRRVAEGSAQDFRAIWAFSQPPAGNADKFRKLSDAEATQIARERWGVDGTEVGFRPDRELVLHRAGC